MKRDYLLKKQCSHEGCNEVGVSSYATRREHIEASKKNRPYTCLRHTRPNEVLSISNITTQIQLRCVSKGSDKFWQRTEFYGTEKLDSGFQHGNGYKAWANDFPEGTILTVTAEICTPPK